MESIRKADRLAESRCDSSANDTFGQRVVILAPTLQDAELCSKILNQHEIAGHVCPSLTELLNAIEAGAGVAVVAQEFLTDHAIEKLRQTFDRQPEWSELPLVVLLKAGEISNHTLEDLLSLQHVTLVNRPLRIAVFLNTICAKLRDRKRQYDLRDLLAEKDRTQQELRREARRLDMAVQAGGMGAWEWSQTQIYWSEAIRKLYGFDISMKPSEDAMFAAIVEQDRQRIREQWSQAISNDEPFRSEHRIWHPTLGERWLAAVAEPVKSKIGDTVRYAGMQWDITDRKRVELELLESHKTFEHLINENPQGLYVVDSDLRIRYASRGTRKVFSKTQPLIGCLFEDAMNAIWPATFVSEAVARFRHTLATGIPYQAPTLIETRTDTHVQEVYDWSIERIVLPGNKYGIVCHFYDNTDRQLSVDMAREGERYFREIANASPAMLWVTDESHQCTFLSKCWHETTGQTESEGLGIGWVNATHPDDHDRVSREFMEAAQNHRLFTSEYRLRMVDGSYRWAVDVGRPRFDHSGKFLGYTGYVIDVNDRKLFEQSLDASRQLAENANRSRGEFLANMSHEIRTPMAAILGHADILRDHLQNPDNIQVVETIRRNGHFLLNIINDILDLSKIDAGKMMIEKEPVRPDGLLAEVRSLMDVRASEKRLPLKVEFDGPIPEMVRTDAVRLRQVLLNLVGNAIKFTDKGEVRVVVKYEPSSSGQHNECVSHAQAGAESTRSDQMIFEIIDTGIGIKPEDLRVLFQPFTQADNTSTREFGGTGLGLTICRRLAHALGGDVKVDSTYGHGSRFTLTIEIEAIGPLVEPNLSISNSTKGEVETLSIDGTVLVVDDRRDIRYLAQHFIERAGGTVLTSTNGKEAIDLVYGDGQGKIDLIVMDMQMPIMDGYEATAELRRRGCQIPIIALTANAMMSDRDECLAAGCSDYTTKPLDSTSLINKIARLMQ